MQILDKKQIELADRIGMYWYKDGVERIYLDCVTFYGLQLIKATDGKADYNTLTAYCDGKRLDKKEADRLESMLRSGKVWVDYATGEFGSKNLEPEIFERIVNNFLKKIQEVTK